MEAREFFEDSGFGLLPTDDMPLSPEEELDNAVAARLEDVHAIADRPVAPIPFGRSWNWDWDRGRFHRVGSAPAEVREHKSLYEWILNALHTAAGHHPTLPDSFGIEDPGAMFGEVDPSLAMSDWEREVEVALLAHDRIKAVDSIELEWDPTAGIVYLTRMDVITDEGEAVALLDIPIDPEV